MLRVHNISESKQKGLKRKHGIGDLQLEDDSANGREDRLDSTRGRGGRVDATRGRGGREDAARGKGGRVDNAKKSGLDEAHDDGGTLGETEKRDYRERGYRRGRRGYIGERRRYRGGRRHYRGGRRDYREGRRDERRDDRDGEQMQRTGWHEEYDNEFSRRDQSFVINYYSSK